MRQKGNTMNFMNNYNAATNPIIIGIDFKNVTTIGQSAFKECKGLTKVIIPSGVKEIPWSTFYDCEKIEKVIIPASVVKIGDYAFEYCYALGNVVIPNKQCSVGSDAFYGIKGHVIR